MFHQAHKSRRVLANDGRSSPCFRGSRFQRAESLLIIGDTPLAVTDGLRAYPKLWRIPAAKIAASITTSTTHRYMTNPRCDRQQNRAGGGPPAYHRVPQDVFREPRDFLYGTPRSVPRRGAVWNFLGRSSDIRPGGVRHTVPG